MRQTWQCPKCNSTKVGYFETLVADATADARRVGLRDSGSGVFHGFVSAGEFEAYVCTECGHFEQYVKNPATMDWNRMVGFRWCRPDANRQGPFR